MALTIHIDGQPGRACVTPISSPGKKVVTIEAIGADKVGKAVQERMVIGRAAVRLLPGGATMSATALFQTETQFSDADIRRRHGRQHLPL